MSPHNSQQGLHVFTLRNVTHFSIHFREQNPPRLHRRQQPQPKRRGRLCVHMDTHTSVTRQSVLIFFFSLSFSRLPPATGGAGKCALGSFLLMMTSVSCCSSPSLDVFSHAGIGLYVVYYTIYKPRDIQTNVSSAVTARCGYIVYIHF